MFNFRRRKRLQSAKQVRKYNCPIAIRIQNLKDSSNTHILAEKSEVSEGNMCNKERIKSGENTADPLKRRALEPSV